MSKAPKEKTKICPCCEATYGGRAQICKHCPERLVYIDGGELVPLVEVAVPPDPHEDITYWYTHIHVYLDGVECVGEAGRRCHYANVEKGFVLLGREFEHLPDETVYGNVEIVFGEPTPMRRKANE